MGPALPVRFRKSSRRQCLTLVGVFACKHTLGLSDAKALSERALVLFAYVWDVVRSILSMNFFGLKTRPAGEK